MSLIGQFVQKRGKSRTSSSTTRRRSLGAGLKLLRSMFSRRVSGGESRDNIKALPLLRDANLINLRRKEY